jgi:hypothetical protein
MKNIDLLPRQRINTLIDNLCKYAEIYEKDRRKFDDMKKMDIWETFASEDYLYINEDTKLKKTKKISSRDSMLISTKTGLYYQTQSSSNNINIKKNSISGNAIFSDEQIRSLFFEFNLSLLEAYDEKKHFDVNPSTQDHNFLHEKFIEDSKPEIRKFLLYILELPLFDILVQNMTHVVDNKHKNKNKDAKLKSTHHTINPVLREAALIPNFEKTYKMIISGLNRRKKGKSILKLIKLSTRIYNTISMPSPKYEKLPYVQNNIFIDPMHEEGINHTESLPLNLVKVDFGFMNYELKEQNEFYANLLKDEMNYIKGKGEESFSIPGKEEFSTNTKANTKANPKENTKSNPKENTKTNNKANPKENPKENTKENTKANKEDKNKKEPKDNIPFNSPFNDKTLKPNTNRESNSNIPPTNTSNNNPYNNPYNNTNAKEKDLLNILRSITYEMNVKNPLTVEFKHFVLNNSELVKMYFGFILSKLRSLINKKNEAILTSTVTATNNPNNILTNTTEYFNPLTRERENSILTTNNHLLTQNNLTSLNALNATNATTSLNLLKNLKNFKREAFYNLTEKEDYIKNFNSFYETYIKDKTNPMVEFHISFGVNFLTTISICDICKRPNTIWDIRKEIIFSKGKRESKTRCKFCENFFVPFFYILEEVNDSEEDDGGKGNYNNINKRKSFNVIKNSNQNQIQNRSFDENKEETHINVVNDFNSNFEKNENLNFVDKTKNKKLRKIEYMSFEHIMTSYYDWDNDANFDKNISPLNRTKKFPYNLFYNICLLMGEIKIRINDKSKMIEVFTLESYMKRHMKKDEGCVINSNENFINNNNNVHTLQSSDNVMKVFRDNYLRKKKELDEEKRKQMRSIYNFFPKKKKDMTKNKMVNIKFDLKDLMTEEKFNEFQKDLGEIPQFNKKNVVKGVMSTRESKNTTGNNGTANVSPFKIAQSYDNPNNFNYDIPTNTYTTSSNNIPNGRVSNISKSKSKSRSKSPSSRVYINLIDKNKLDNHTHDKEHYKHLNKRSKSKSRSKSPLNNIRANSRDNIPRDSEKKNSLNRLDDINTLKSNNIKNILTVKLEDNKYDLNTMIKEKETSRPLRSRSPGKNRGNIRYNKPDDITTERRDNISSNNVNKKPNNLNINLRNNEPNDSTTNNRNDLLNNNSYNITSNPGNNKMLITTESSDNKDTNSTSSLRRNLRPNKEKKEDENDFLYAKDVKNLKNNNNFSSNNHPENNYGSYANNFVNSSAGLKNKKAKNSNFLKIFDQLAKDTLIKK